MLKPRRLSCLIILTFITSLSFWCEAEDIPNYTCSSSSERGRHQGKDSSMYRSLYKMSDHDSKCKESPSVKERTNELKETLENHHADSVASETVLHEEANKIIPQVTCKDSEGESSLPKGESSLPSSSSPLASNSPSENKIDNGKPQLSSGDNDIGAKSEENENWAELLSKQVSEANTDSTESYVDANESVPMLVDSQTSEMDTSEPPVVKEAEQEFPDKFPDTLEGFGYSFNDKGELRDMKTGGKFNFNVKEGDHHYNQKRYECIGEIITEYVYTGLEKKFGLKRIYLPIDAKEDEPRSFIFASDDYKTNSRLMILIHGAGVVKAGQWARRLIINDNLNSGTQFPFIERAIAAGYAIVVLNTNLNYVDKDDERIPIKHNAGPDDHGLYVWDKIISPHSAKHIAIVAHSFGGVVTEEIIFKRYKEVSKKVFAVAFTDSVHSIHSGFHFPGETKKAIKFFKEVAVNWVSSKKPLDTRLEAFDSADCTRLSAGHSVHEMTSWSSINSVFKFLAERWERRARVTKADDSSKI